MTDYSGERGKPEVPTCRRSSLTLTFDGTHVHLQDGSGELLVYPAVSGKKKDGSFTYDRERQALKEMGPIPEGKYWINPSQLWQRNWKTDLGLRLRATFSDYTYETISEAHDGSWGKYRLTIHPYPGTETHGRGGFFFHGGDTPGSAGCIDLTDKMGEFVQDLTKRVGKDNDCFIPLTVDYGGSGS